jgi:hypothetical protein
VFAFVLASCRHPWSFAATTVSAGVVAAFLPLAAGVSGGVAALGLFAQAVASTVSRWWAGRHRAVARDVPIAAAMFASDCDRKDPDMTET